MTKLIQYGLLPLLVFMAMGLGAPAMLAQDDEPGLGDTYEPDPNADITVDFVQKDIHTVMHYIALRSGLQIIVEGEVEVRLTVMFRKVNPKEAIQSICKANKLDYIEDGNVIIIKARPQTSQLANVVKGERADRYNVNFESHSLVAAIMEVASVTGAQVFIPALPPERNPSPDGSPRGGGGDEGSPEDETLVKDYVTQIQERQVSMFMREAKRENILERLADLGGLDVKRVPLSDSGEELVEGFQFSYKPLAQYNPEGGVSADPDEKIETEDWTIPGADMTEVKNQVTELLSTRGKLVVDDTTDYIRVFDTQTYLDRITLFLNALEEQMSVYVAASNEVVDDLIVREYRMIRDSSDGTLLASLQQVLSPDGRLVTNPDRNSIVVYERESLMKNIDRIMAALDAQPEQVLITAKLIEVSLDEYMGYGLELFTSHSADNLNNGRFTGSSQDSANTVGGLFGQPTGFDPFFATFSNPRIDVRLELLANEGRVETLSQPTQMVSNREQARIEVGQEIPYLESSGATGGTTTASVSFKEVSIVMDVTPTVLENGLIRLDVTVTVREVVGNVAIEGNNTPVLSKRESKTNVFIRDGETLVMGGLLRERERMDENGLPFLKDIPFLGYLFKSANRTKSKTDLLFFLRPQIVNVLKGAQISEIGEAVERDLRPLIYEEGDQKKSNIRDGRFRKLERATKPAWYNEKARPKTAKDVKPGA